jgi:hypothetical protein
MKMIRTAERIHLFLMFSSKRIVVFSGLSLRSCLSATVTRSVRTAVQRPLSFCIPMWLHSTKRDAGFSDRPTNLCRL